MLIDTHVHSAGISTCARRKPEALIAEYIASKTDGFVLCNHCLRDYIKDGDYREWYKKYVAEYELCKKLGDKYGIKVFFGIEISPDHNLLVHYLIYGITPEELLVAPELYALSQEELYSYCKENGFMLVQAHPFRNGMVPQNPDFLDGYEINCHPGYRTNMRDEVTAVANKSGKTIICGSDFHGDHYKPRCGTIIPDNIKTEKELCDYLKNNQPELLIVDVINVEL